MTLNDYHACIFRCFAHRSPVTFLYPPHPPPPPRKMTVLLAAALTASHDKSDPIWPMMLEGRFDCPLVIDGVDYLLGRLSNTLENQ